MSFDPDEFAEVAESFRVKMLATLMVPDRMIAYDGTIDGIDCIVVGWVEDPTDPLASVKPLAIVITPEIFDVLEVKATKVGR